VASPLHGSVETLSSSPESSAARLTLPVTDSANSKHRNGRGKIQWPLLIALAALATLSGWFLRAAKSQASSAGSPNVVSTLHLDPFVLNLEDPEGRSYLRVGIDLGVSVDVNRRSISETLPMALLRDTVIGVLSRAKPGDLLRADGKAKLKDDLAAALRQRAPQLGVQEVYFTDFLVQR
jgi:flagellar basal body-associated protein FliL